MEHSNTASNTALMKKLYNDFASGDFPSMLAALPDNVTFQIAGKSKLAGKFDKSNFIAKLAMPLMELSGGSFKPEIHDVMASDRHAMILATNRVTRDGKTLEYRTVHVWRIENGKPIAGYEYPRDMYQFDMIWG